MIEKGRQYKLSYGCGVFFAIFTVAIFVIGAFARADVGHAMDFVIIPMEVACTVGTILLFVLGAKQKDEYLKAKRQHEENQRNMYD